MRIGLAATKDNQEKDGDAWYGPDTIHADSRAISRGMLQLESYDRLPTRPQKQ